MISPTFSRLAVKWGLLFIEFAGLTRCQIERPEAILSGFKKRFLQGIDRPALHVEALICVQLPPQRYDGRKGPAADSGVLFIGIVAGINDEQGVQHAPISFRR